MSILNTIDRTVARAQRVSDGTRLDGLKSIGIDTPDIDLLERSSSYAPRHNTNAFDVETIKVGGASFSAIKMQDAVAFITLLVQKGTTPHHVVTGNLDHLYRLENDEEFQQVYRSASLVLPDGMPVVWLSRLFRLAGEQGLPERVAGSDLLIEHARHSSIRRFASIARIHRQSRSSRRDRRHHAGVDARQCHPARCGQPRRKRNGGTGHEGGGFGNLYIGM